MGVGREMRRELEWDSHISSVLNILLRLEAELSSWFGDLHFEN